MTKFKIGEFVEGDAVSKCVRWQKWTALLNDNLEWFGITKPGQTVKAPRIYEGEGIRVLVDSLPEPVLEEEAGRSRQNYG